MNVEKIMTPPRGNGNLTVRNHLRHLRLEGKSAITIYHRERLLARLACVLPVPLQDATAKMLYDWRADLEVGDSTVICYVSHVKEFYKWLADQQIITADPAARIPVPKMPRRQPHPIAEDDLMLAVNAATPMIRIWLVLAGWCGLRAKEIALLRTDAVKLHDPVQPHLRVLHTATKGRAERTVPLPPFAQSELAKAAPLFSPQGLAFRDALGRPIEPWFVSRKCNEHLHDLGIASTLHSLRHRYGTQITHISKDLQLTQQLLGHADIATSAGYAAVDTSGFAPTVNAIPAPLVHGTAALMAFLYFVLYFAAN